jgi:hypothetical protein
MQSGIVGMNDQSAIRAYRTCPENLGMNILAVVISVERRSFWKHVYNMETFGVPHNC